MSEPTDPDSLPLPVWYSRLHGEIFRCTRVRELRPILKALSALELAGRLDGDEWAEDLAVSLYRTADQHAADLGDKIAVSDNFEWRPLPSADTCDGEPVCYLMEVRRQSTVSALEVARLSRCDNGAWQATLNQHLPRGARFIRPCSSLETGRWGVELWAARHFGRLHGQVTAILAGFPSGSRDECRAPGCTRGHRLFCTKCEAAFAALAEESLEGFRQEMARGRPVEDDDGEEAETSA